MLLGVPFYFSIEVEPHMPWMIHISGLALLRTHWTIHVARIPHSPSTMTQLSRARFSIKLIACRAGIAIPKAKETPSLSFLFTSPCRRAGGTQGRKKKDPINLLWPMIINSWAWSYFIIEKRKKTFVDKFYSYVAPFFLSVKQCQTKISNKHYLFLKRRWSNCTF